MGRGWGGDCEHSCPQAQKRSECFIIGPTAPPNPPPRTALEPSGQAGRRRRVAASLSWSKPGRPNPAISRARMSRAKTRNGLLLAVGCWLFTVLGTRPGASASRLIDVAWSPPPPAPLPPTAFYPSVLPARAASAMDLARRLRLRRSRCTAAVAVIAVAVAGLPVVTIGQDEDCTDRNGSCDLWYTQGYCTYASYASCTCSLALDRPSPPPAACAPTPTHTYTCRNVLTRYLPRVPFYP